MLDGESAYVRDCWPIAGKLAAGAPQGEMVAWRGAGRVAAAAAAAAPAPPRAAGMRALSLPAGRGAGPSRDKLELEIVNVRQRVPYSHGLALLKGEQQAKLDALRQDGAAVPRDSLIFLEHDPVYTLGRGADESNVLFDVEDADAVPVYRTERGGEVTYHGPGQIVGYPVLDLRRHKRDLHWYMRQVEEVVIDVLGTYGVRGGRKEAYTGVWVGDAKVAAIGLNASKWVTSHGFALNVTTDLGAFSKIVPCGITEPGTSVTSLRALLGQDAELGRAAVQERVARSFMRVFGFSRAHVRDQ